MLHNRYWLVYIFLLFNNLIQAQDFDVYPRLKGDNIKMPELYENTFFDEYQILSRDIRMMDMAYSALAPGYVHFKAKDNTLGYSILAARLIGYGGLLMNYIYLEDAKNSSGDIYTFNEGKSLFYSSISLIISSYLFDWIHGKYRLEKKQELIRYKYSIKIKMNLLSQKESVNTQSVGLSLNIKLK